MPFRGDDTGLSAKIEDIELRLRTIERLALSGDTALSAYQLAVIDGFTGSVTEWLASLKGEAGSIDGSSHTVLTDRDVVDQHPISAISSLQGILDTTVINGGGVSTIMVITSAAYALLTPPDASTLYMVVG